jgi:tRNA nucleotidyltransferase (CCA-adding enzyme)
MQTAMNIDYSYILHNLNNTLLFEKNPTSALSESLFSDLCKIPHIAAMIDCPQDPEWHPEGDVWSHTILVVEKATKYRHLFSTEVEKSAFMLGAFFHDIGKPLTTIYKDDRWRSPSHDVKGAKICRDLLLSANFPEHIANKAASYTLEHLKPINLYKNRDKVSNSAIRRLAARINISDLILLAKSDHFGRTTQDAIDEEFPAGDWLLAKYNSILKYDNKPKPLLKGRLLAGYGLKPGKIMGQILSESIRAQIDGEISNKEEARLWAKERLKQLGYLK